MTLKSTTKHGVRLLGLASLLLAACTGKDGAAPANNTAATKAAVSAQKAAVDTYVAAVTSSKPGAPLSMKFELDRKPKLGEPLGINVILTPEANGITGLQAVFQGSNDLQIKTGGELSLMTPLPAGEGIHHSVVVTPVREGIYYMTVVAVTEGGGSQARTFSIPIVVGDASALEPGKTPPPLDAKGERVSSLPAADGGSTP